MRLRGTAITGVVLFAAMIFGVMQLRVAAQGGTSASARNSSNTVADVHWFHPPASSGHASGTPVVGASSTMIRNAEAVSYTIDTNGLTPGDAATNWWIVFNNPQFCSPPGCGSKDFPQNGGDPKVEASVYWATGAIVDAHGFVHFAAHQLVGGAAPGQVLFGPGLLDRNAEIHIVTRTHGPASTNAATLNAQLTTFGGACSSSNPCFDQQAARHNP
jgi:hypothetical protein